MAMILVHIAVAAKVDLCFMKCKILLSLLCCLFRYLYKNHIRSMDVGAFRGLTNLEQL